MLLNLRHSESKNLWDEVTRRGFPVSVSSTLYSSRTWWGKSTQSNAALIYVIGNHDSSSMCINLTSGGEQRQIESTPSMANICLLLYFFLQQIYDVQAVFESLIHQGRKSMMHRSLAPGREHHLECRVLIENSYVPSWRISVCFDGFYNASSLSMQWCWFVYFCVQTKICGRKNAKFTQQRNTKKSFSVSISQHF